MELTIKEKADIIKKIKIPKHERVCESYWEYGKIKYIITETLLKQYLLYTVDDSLNLKKIEEKDNPKDFKKYKRSKEFLQDKE